MASGQLKVIDWMMDGELDCGESLGDGLGDVLLFSVDE